MPAWAAASASFNASLRSCCGSPSIECTIRQYGAFSRPLERRRPSKERAGSAMPQRSDISDADDPRIADYVDLTDSDLRRRVEAERGYFIAESPLVIRALVAADRSVRSILVTEKQYDSLID